MLELLAALGGNPDVEFFSIDHLTHLTLGYTLFALEPGQAWNLEVLKPSTFWTFGFFYPASHLVAVSLHCNHCRLNGLCVSLLPPRWLRLCGGNRLRNMGNCGSCVPCQGRIHRGSVLRCADLFCFVPRLLTRTAQISLPPVATS